MPDGYIRNPKKDKRGLTPKEAIFTDNVLEVGTQKAAEMAYPDCTPESQDRMSRKNMDKPEVVHSISKELDLQGVRNETLCQAIKRGLDEDSPKAYLKAAELGFKLKGHLREGNNVNITNVGMESAIDFCRAYFQAKSEHKGV